MRKAEAYVRLAGAREKNALHDKALAVRAAQYDSEGFAKYMKTFDEED